MENLDFFLSGGPEDDDNNSTAYDGFNPFGPGSGSISNDDDGIGADAFGSIPCFSDDDN